MECEKFFEREISVISLNNAEMQSICGGGYFYWDSSTKTLWYHPY
jgi:hypothetical protein